MKNITTILVFLTTTILFSQNDKVIGNVKSIRENLVYLDKQPEIPKNCLDCDTNSLYQFGIAIVGSPKDYDGFFLEDWKNSRYATYKNREQKFNQKGYKTEETWYEGDNSIYKKFEYQYDVNDSIIETKENYANFFTTINKRTYLNNLLMSEINFTVKEDKYDDDYSYKYYIYDDNKNLIQKSIFNESGFDFSSHYINNSFGKQIQQDNIDSNNEKRLVWKRLYDEKNRLIETQKYDINKYTKKDSVIERLLVKYNRNNKIIQRKYIVFGFEKEYNLEYDKDNNIKRFYTYSASKPNNYGYYYFRKNNRIVKVIIERSEDSFTTTFDYKDDEKGNWIEQTKSVNGKALFIWKRKIEYYE